MYSTSTEKHVSPIFPKMFSPDFQGMKKRGKKYRVKIEVALRIFHSSVQVLQNIGIFHSNQMQKCILKNLQNRPRTTNQHRHRCHFPTLTILTSPCGKVDYSYRVFYVSYRIFTYGSHDLYIYLLLSIYLSALHLGR